MTSSTEHTADTADTADSAVTPPVESFQIPIEAAEAYEAAFVPAFFAQWAPMLCAAAGVAPGQRVLDAACGTGIVARTAADLIGATGVVGVDLNEAMLTVARRIRPDIDWRQADVVALPLPDHSFDVVLCQMALMFFPDRRAALRELARVVVPGGTVAVLVPSELAAQPVYGPFVEMAAGHGGDAARSLLGAYFSCGDPDLLAGLLGDAGLEVASVGSLAGRARYPSVDALVTTEVESTPLGERLTADALRRIHAGAREVLARFVTDDGSLDGPFECRVAVARVPGGPAS